jgi:O-antigen/teichoic acid export membrane protein
VWKVAALLAASVGFLSLLVALNGEFLVHALYAPPSLEGVQGIVFILAFATFIGSAGHAFDSGLLAVERPDINLIAALIGLVITFAVAAMLTSPLGVLGTATGILLGTAVAAVFQIAAFTRLVGKPAILTSIGAESRRR